MGACFLLVIDELSLRVYQASLIRQLQFLKGRRYIIRLAAILRLLLHPILLLYPFRILTITKIAVISALTLFLLLLLLAGFDLVLGIVGIDPIIVLYLRSIYTIRRSLLLYSRLLVVEVALRPDCFQKLQVFRRGLTWLFFGFGGSG